MKYLLLFAFVQSWISSISSAWVYPKEDNEFKPDGDNVCFTADIMSLIVMKKTALQQNVVFSPTSIESAMGVCLLAAGGKTKHQLAKHVFHIDIWARYKNFDDYLRNMANLSRNPSRPKNESELRILNLVLVNNASVQVLDSFKTEVSDILNAKIIPVNIVSPGTASDVARKTNKVVEKITNNRIKDLLPEDSLSDQTTALFVNVLYLKVAWSTPFDQLQTTQENFYPNPSREALNKNIGKVPMMKGKQKNTLYYEDELIQAVKLNFDDEMFSMYVILPKLESTTTLDQENCSQSGRSKGIGYLLNNPGAMKLRTVNVQLPKFKIEHSPHMKSILQEIGVTDAFDTHLADFRRMTGTPPGSVWISDVIHKAVIEVTESGIEAAAATAVQLETRMAESHTNLANFIADHPFSFYVTARFRSKGTKNVYESILFAGKYYGEM